MAVLMKGAKVCAGMEEALRAERAELERMGVAPKLAIVRVGAVEGVLAWEREILKRLDGLEIMTHIVALPEDIPRARVEAELARANGDPSVHGVLLSRPMPTHLDGGWAWEAIDPIKDVDGTSPINLAKLFVGELDESVPCRASAVMEMLAHYGVSLEGKAVTIIAGDDKGIGRSLAMLMLAERAAVTICDARTADDMPSICRSADVLVTSVGKASAIGMDHVSGRSIVVDTGIDVGLDGDVCGDVDFSSVEPIVSMISPVPRGVGPVTAATLARNVLKAARLQQPRPL